MQDDALPLQVIRLASKTFAREKGLSGPEIMDFFRQYADDIPDYYNLSNVPSRWRLFEDCLRRFPSAKQRHILLDLCGWEGPMKWGRPESNTIATLRRLLVEGEPVHEFARQLREVRAQTAQEEMWDVFICHASEDKKTVARPLAQTLSQKGLKVWYDEFTLKLGDSLRRSIDCGLAQSRYGVVILSPDFFAKEWPQRELDGLAVLELDGEKKILPVWHNVSREDVARYSPTLADRLAASTREGIDIVVAKILDVVQPDAGRAVELPSSVGRIVESTSASCPSCGDWRSTLLEVVEPGVLGRERRKCRNCGTEFTCRPQILWSDTGYCPECDSEKSVLIGRPEGYGGLEYHRCLSCGVVYQFSRLF